MRCPLGPSGFPRQLTYSVLTWRPDPKLPSSQTSPSSNPHSLALVWSLGRPVDSQQSCHPPYPTHHTARLPSDRRYHPTHLSQPPHDNRITNDPSLPHRPPRDPNQTLPALTIPCPPPPHKPNGIVQGTKGRTHPSHPAPTTPRTSSPTDKSKRSRLQSTQKERRQRPTAPSPKPRETTPPPDLNNVPPSPRYLRSRKTSA